MIKLGGISTNIAAFKYLLSEWYNIWMTNNKLSEFALWVHCGAFNLFGQKRKYVFVYFNRKRGSKHPFPKIIYYNPICLTMTFCETYMLRQWALWNITADYLLVIVEDKPFTLWRSHGFTRILIVINYAKSKQCVIWMTLRHGIRRIYRITCLILFL